MESTGKNLVICCDGTGNQFGDENSNVVRLYTTLTIDPSQVAYYHPGVGTMGAANVSGRVAKTWTKWLGLGFGRGFKDDLSDAYRYLMDNYRTGDRIYLFGFSRGAYLVRALAGALHVYGLLCAGNEGHLAYLVEMYSELSRDAYQKANGKRDERTMHGDDVANAFRETYSREVTVHFMGIWDTVSSVGWITDPVKLLYDGQNPIVQTCYHAVSVDERRCFFQANLWGDPLPMAKTRLIEKLALPAQKVVQAWFAGVHSDVGGSYPQAESWPAMQAYHWMLEAAEAEGLVVHRARRAAVEGEAWQAVTAADEEFEREHQTRFPALVAHYPPPLPWHWLHESLKGAWWLLEFFPHKYYDAAGEKHWQLTPWAHRREIPDHALLHPSLLAWLNDPHAGVYAPKNLDRTRVVAYAEEPVWYPQPELMQELAAGGYGVYRLKGGVKKEASGGKTLGVAAALLMMAGVGWAMFRR